MRKFFIGALSAFSLFGMSPAQVQAAPALEVLGKDFVFPNTIAGVPAKLSDFKDLEINSFVTNDGVKLSYWEAGKGRPLVFIPGWSGNGAEFVNVMYLLSKHYHVYVLDPRNQGLSQRVDFGGRISRFAMDLKGFTDHLGLKSADYCGHSMGSAVLWSYIDLFGTKGINKVAFVDNPLSIYTHDDWSEQDRLNAGGMTTSPERMVAAFTQGAPTNNMVVDMYPAERSQVMDSPYYVNSQALAGAFIKNDPKALSHVLFDHTTNDWRDVVRRKVNVPVALFSGDLSHNLPSYRWMKSVMPNATLYAYTQEEKGDHFLMFKNPIKFTRDLQAFLER